MKLIKTIPLFFTILWGCGLFQTRSPENPDTRRSTFYPPTTPEAVITNLGFAISEKNSTNYSRCISQTTYRYVPDSKSQLLYGQIFDSWTPAAERYYFDNLISNTGENATSYLFLSDKITNLITPDSAITTADYIVVFQHNRSSVPKTSEGNLRFILKADESNNFYIVWWEDFRQNDTDFTWSELKANFSN